MSRSELEEAQDSWKGLQKQISNSVGRLLLPPDHILFQQNVYEFSISHRLGMYIENELALTKSLGSRVVDCDYNKLISGSETLYKRLNRTTLLRALDQLNILLEDKYSKVFSSAQNSLTENIASAKRRLNKKDLNARPDIILHERNTDKFNSLMLELKANTTGQTAGSLIDCARLLIFTSPMFGVKPLYDCGLFIRIRYQREGPVVTESLVFSNGSCFIAVPPSFHLNA